MARLSTILATTAFALGLASAALARPTASAAGGAQISNQGGIQTTGEVIFKDIVVTPRVAPPPVVPSSASANVTVTGVQGDAVSLAVPETLKAVSPETGQSVTVVTTADGEYAAIEGLQTLLSTGGILSVDVGGSIHINSTQLQPGEYQGLLVVVAQYN